MKHPKLKIVVEQLGHRYIFWKNKKAKSSLLISHFEENDVFIITTSNTYNELQQLNLTKDSVKNIIKALKKLM